MSAANMDLNVQTLQQIGGALQQLNADGTVDQAGTQQLLANLQHSLGGNFTQTAVADNLHQDFVKEGGSFGVEQLVAMVAAVALSCILGPEVMAAFDALIDPIAFAAIAPGLVDVASVVSTGLAVGTTAFVSSSASQFIATGSLDIGSSFKSAAVAALTAGLTQGLVGNSGITTTGTVTEANPATTLSNLGNTAINVGERGLISAGVATAINGGSFGNALLGSVSNDLAAVGANWIGTNIPGVGASGANLGTEAANALAHAALGCAAQSLNGGDCAGGAIGGATSAIVAPLVRDGLYGDTQTVTGTTNSDGSLTLTTSYENQAYNAITTAISMLAGGTLAGMLGESSTSAAAAAQNEALNNAMAAKTRTLMTHAYSFVGQPAGALSADDIRQTIRDLNIASRDPSLTVQERNWLHNAALNAYMAGAEVGLLSVGEISMVTNATIPSAAFSGGGVGRLPNGAIPDNVLPTTTGSRTAVTLGGTSKAVSQADIDALTANGVKFTPQNVVATGTTQSGQIVFLETGSTRAGLQHIVDAHATDFANIGVSQEQIPAVVMQAVTQGNIVGYQGRGSGRPIYQTTINGQPQRIAVSVSTNGFIVGANPAGRGQ